MHCKKKEEKKKEEKGGQLEGWREQGGGRADSRNFHLNNNNSNNFRYAHSSKCVEFHRGKKADHNPKMPTQNLVNSCIITIAVGNKKHAMGRQIWEVGRGASTSTSINT